MRWGGSNFIRFALVGAGVAALYVVLYGALLALHIAQPLANAVAFLTAVAVQYIGQAGFTFDAPWRDMRQAARFGGMICLGLATSAVITGAIGPALDWPAMISAVVVTLVLPIQNYVIMSRWVFARRGSQLETFQ